MSEEGCLSWAGQRVGITGAGGFIGSHLVEALVRAGADARALVHYNSRSDWGSLDTIDIKLRDQVEVVAGDLRDCDAVRHFVAGCRAVFHLGAQVGIPYSYESPRDVIQTNVQGTLNVLEAARAGGVERLVHTSTSEVYGTARYRPIDEAHPLQGQSPYAASKIGADKLVESYYLSFGVPVVTVRPFNTYGPRQSQRAVIPTIIAQALVGQEIRLGSLEPRRDFNFVADTVRGFLLAGQVPRVEGAVINLGTGLPTSVGEIAKAILNLLGSSIPIVADVTRVRPPASEVMWLEANASRATDMLGWRPLVGIADGLQQTISWMRNHLARYRSAGYGV